MIITFGYIKKNLEKKKKKKKSTGGGPMLVHYGYNKEGLLVMSIKGRD
jgi:hypothetical protein